jgi:hypothetical protein
LRRRLRIGQVVVEDRWLSWIDLISPLGREAGHMATAADLQAAYDRVMAANKQLEEVWPDRETTKVAETRAAIDEVNDAGMELNRIQEQLGK